jgi:hypothetical protein
MYRYPSAVGDLWDDLQAVVGDSDQGLLRRESFHEEKGYGTRASERRRLASDSDRGGDERERNRERKTRREEGGEREWLTCSEQTGWLGARNESIERYGVQTKIDQRGKSVASSTSCVLAGNHHMEL